MKKLILTLLLVVIAFPAFAEGREKESSYDRVLKTNILRCAYASAAPNIYKDLNTGEIFGPVAEIATMMADVLKLKIEWVAEVGYADFAEGLKTGRYDAFCGILALAPTRARVVAFTSPIYYVPYFAYVRQDETRFKTLDDINNPDIVSGAIDGEVFQMMARKHFPKTKEHSLPNMTSSAEIFVDLANKKSDVIIHDPLLALQYTKHNPDKVRLAFEQPLELYPIGYALAPHEQELQDMLNTGILSLHNLGKIEAILNKYHVSGQTYYPVAKSYEVLK